jgi:hypothetical protein
VSERRTAERRTRQERECAGTRAAGARTEHDSEEELHDEHGAEDDEEDVIDDRGRLIGGDPEHVHLVDPALERDGLEDRHEGVQDIIVRERSVGGVDLVILTRLLALAVGRRGAHCRVVDPL